jgi:hypothetical protein
MYGQDIVSLQNRLLSFGFFEVDNVDGYSGPFTAEVIKMIQCFSGFEQNKHCCPV